MTRSHATNLARAPYHLAALGFSLLVWSGCPRKDPGAGEGGTVAAPAPSKPAAMLTSKSVAEPAPSKSVAEPAPTQGATGASSAACDTLCAKSSELGCSNSKACIDSCRDMQASPVCGKEIGEFLFCLQGEPVAHWECAEDGVAAIKDGYCESVQAALAKCLEAQAS